MQRYMTPEQIRSYLDNHEEDDDFDICDASEDLFDYLDKLEETPEDYGFEFVVDGDENCDAEGVRERYYAYRLAEGILPDGCALKVYVTGYPFEGEHTEDTTLVEGWNVEGYADGEQMFDSGPDTLPTMEAVVEYLEPWIGYKLKKVAP